MVFAMNDVSINTLKRLVSWASAAQLFTELEKGEAVACNVYFVQLVSFASSSPRIDIYILHQITYDNLYNMLLYTIRYLDYIEMGTLLHMSAGWLKTFFRI